MIVPVKEEKKNPRNKVQKSVCQMLCLIILQFIFLMSGSAIFMLLERESAQETYNNTLDMLIQLREEGKLNLSLHEEEVLKKAFGAGFSFRDTELPSSAKQAWDFISTLYFSITSTTTIGYGHHSPKTQAGQIFCIAFSLLGIPLHMVTLTTIGKHLNTVIYRFLHWSAGREFLKSPNRKDLGTFGVTCTLLILFVIFSAGSVKLIMKGATYTEAIYFIYVTISTIGFGDFVIRFEEESEVNRLLILTLWAMSVYVGMTILSATVMSISNRAKQGYKSLFDLWNKHILGETFKRPAGHRHRTRGAGAAARDDDFVMVDIDFLIAQLDLQTDPNKRAEIQHWIDEIADSDGSEGDYTSEDSEYYVESECSDRHTNEQGASDDS